jgi:hypothetical protein
MSNQSVAKFFSLLALLLVSIPYGVVGNRAFAQKLSDANIAIMPFAQFTSSTSGNGVTQKPSKSGGGLISFRQSFLKPWLGYEVNYSYTRFSEEFNLLPFSVQDNVHEATAAALLQGPNFGSLRPFGAVGGGALLFLPTSVGGQRYNQQFRKTFLYELGVNYALFSSHFGLRAEYRGLIYDTPNFNQPALTAGGMRQTSEPAVGIYIRF